MMRPSVNRSPYLLLFVYERAAEGFAISIGAFGGRGHYLATLRDHRPTCGVVRPTRLLAYVSERVGVYLFHRHGVVRRARSSDLSFRTIVFRCIAGVDRRAIRSLAGGCHLYSAIRRFPCNRDALHRHRSRGVFRLDDVQFPGTERVVGAENDEGS